MSRTLQGIGVSPGVVSGPVARMAPPAPGPTDTGPAEDVEAETAIATAALAAVGADLEARGRRAGGDAAEVLGAQAMMAGDPALADTVARHIRAGRGAAAALAAAFAEFRAQLEGLGGYLAERVADLDDVRNRAVAAALGVPMPGVPDPGHPFVLVADDLAPADTATLDPEQVLAIVTERGGPTSHTAILAKSLGLPAVVACAAAMSVADGETVLVDGATGAVTLDPTEAELAAGRTRQAARAALLGSATGPGRTADGHPVKLLVNLGAARDLAAAASADSEGVGLFRTEFLFLDRPQAPSVDEQRRAYAAVFEAFAGRTVVVRTLDAGADKPLGFVTLPDEPNPALGVRGLRTARRLPELLEGQLAAVAAAAADGTAEVAVMAPMVSTPAEAADFADRVHRHGLSRAGVMVEVPAAALRAAAVLAGCDFVSLGTNDLSQYTFAADRMAGELAELLDPWQAALLELVRITAAAGRAADKPVGVCGEAASDPLLALVLVGLGVTSLSMAPSMLPEVRAHLAGQTLQQCAELAELALAASDGAAGLAAVRDRLG